MIYTTESHRLTQRFLRSLIWSRAGISMVTVAVFSVAWAMLLRGKFQDAWSPDLSSLTSIWEGLWIVVFPVPMGIAFGQASQAGRKRMEVLLDRMPVDAVEVLRARVSLALRFGLPTWLLVSLVLSFGLPFGIWLPWVLVGTAIFCTTLSTVTTLWVSATGRVRNSEPKGHLLSYGVCFLVGLRYLSTKTAQFPGLVEGVVIPALCSALAAYTWHWAKQVARLSALGLDTPPSGKPWWWPRDSYFYLACFIVILRSSTFYLLLLVLILIISLSVTILEYQWKNCQINRQYGLADNGDNRKLALYSILSVLSVGLIVHRLLELRPPSHQTLKSLETLQRDQSVVIQALVVITAVGLSAIALIHLVQKTNKLLAAFSRQDALVLRLPTRRAEIKRMRFKRWARQMVRPIVGLCGLDILVLLLNDQNQNGLAWVGWLVAVQTLFVLLGCLLFLLLVSHKLRRPRAHGS